MLRCYLSANTLIALVDKLCLQEYLDGLSEHELAEVWKRATVFPSEEQDAS